LRLYEEQSSFGRQFDAKAAGRIDLLAVDSQQNLVVVELKAGDADRQVCGQIQAYMGWVKANLAGPRVVRGIIVAHEFTERAKLAATVVPGLTLKKYRVNFLFADA
jgi:RecB family endonuclease NucS